MPLVPPCIPPTESNCPWLGPLRTPPTPLPFSSASGGTALPRQCGHMTDTKAYGWAVAAIHHVVLLGVGGRQEESEWEMMVGDG